VKNIAQPIRVFRLRAAGEPSRPRASGPQAERPPLSIVVLPFDNLSGDPDQEYLADGVTDDLTTDLSRIAGSFVIARNSAFTYKGKAVDVKQIGRELGVAYALEGSLRRSGNRVRINAQLIDTESGAHVWAERFDRDLGDMLALQDDITGSIARALRYELVEAEGRRSLRERPSDPRAIDFVLRAQAALLRGQQVTRENTMEARRHYEEALRLDPALVTALAGISATYLAQHLFGWGTDSTEALAMAEEFIARAERIAPNELRVMSTRGAVLVHQRKPEQAIAIIRRVLERDPNNTAALNNVGWCHMFLGEPAAAIECVEKALRLDPRGFNRSNMHGILGTAQLYLGDFDQAIRYLGEYRDERPEHAFPCFMQAAAFALAGRLDEARAALDAFRRLRPGIGIAKLREEALSRLPKYLALRERVYRGLRLAGLED
jgi:TolB-like protein/Tfp pilus assembly protein PilF